MSSPLFNALHVAGLLRRLPVYDAVAMLRSSSRAGSPARCSSRAAGRSRRGRPAGPPLARSALLVAAILTTLDVGFNLAPTGVYPWWRWQVVGRVYWVYALLECVVSRDMAVGFARFGGSRFTQVRGSGVIERFSLP